MLANIASDPAPIRSILMYCGGLVALLVVVFAGYSYFKKWMTEPEKPHHAGFTLADLRELHRQGKMSDQEFELTKAKMLGTAKKAADQMPSVLPRRAVKPPVDDGRSSPPMG